MARYEVKREGRQVELYKDGVLVSARLIRYIYEQDSNAHCLIIDDEQVEANEENHISFVQNWNGMRIHFDKREEIASIILTAYSDKPLYPDVFDFSVCGEVRPYISFVYKG